MDKIRIAVMNLWNGIASLAVALLGLVSISYQFSLLVPLILIIGVFITSAYHQFKLVAPLFHNDRWIYACMFLGVSLVLLGAYTLPMATNDLAAIPIFLELIVGTCFVAMPSIAESSVKHASSVKSS